MNYKAMKKYGRKFLLSFFVSETNISSRIVLYIYYIDLYMHNSHMYVHTHL